MREITLVKQQQVEKNYARLLHKGFKNAANRKATRKLLRSALLFWVEYTRKTELNSQMRKAFQLLLKITTRKMRDLLKHWSWAGGKARHLKKQCHVYLQSGLGINSVTLNPDYSWNINKRLHLIRLTLVHFLAWFQATVTVAGRKQFTSRFIRRAVEHRAFQRWCGAVRRTVSQAIELIRRKDALRLIFGVRQVFVAWMQHTASMCSAQTGGARLERIKGFLTMQRAFAKFVSAAADKHAKRGRLVKVVLKHMTNMTALFLVLWREFARNQRRLFLQQARASALVFRRSLTYYFNLLREQSVEARVQDSKQSKALRFHRQLLELRMINAFENWVHALTVARQTRKKESIADKLCSKVRLRGFWHDWQETSVVLRKHKRAQAKVILHRERQLFRDCFCVWLHQALRLSRIRKGMMRMFTKHRIGYLDQSLLCWGMHMTYERRLSRIESSIEKREFLNTGLVQITYDCWVTMVGRERKLRSVFRKLLLQRHATSLIKCFKGWHLVVNTAVVRSNNRLKVALHVAQRLSLRTVDNWQQIVLNRRREKVIMSRVKSIQDSHTMGTFLVEWRHAIWEILEQGRSLKRANILHCRKVVSAHFFRWISTAFYSRTLRLRATAFVGHWTRFRLGEAFRRMCEVMIEERRLALRFASLISKSVFLRCKEAFMVWSGYTQGSKVMDIKDARLRRLDKRTCEYAAFKQFAAVVRYERHLRTQLGHASKLMERINRKLMTECLWQMALHVRREKKANQIASRVHRGLLSKHLVRMSKHARVRKILRIRAAQAVPITVRVQKAMMVKFLRSWAIHSVEEKVLLRKAQKLLSWQFYSAFRCEMPERGLIDQTTVYFASLMGLALGYWKRFLQLNRRLMFLASKSCYQVQKFAFFALKDLMQANKETRRVISKQVKRLCLGLLFQCLDFWRTETIAGNLLNRKYTRYLDYSSSMLLRKAFLAFSEGIKRTQREAHIIGTYVLRWHHGTLWSALSTWKLHAKTERTLSTKMKILARKISLRLLYSSLKKWDELVGSHLQDRTLILKAVVRMSGLQEKQAFRIWTTFVSEQKMRLRALKFSARHFYGRAIDAWCIYVLEEKREMKAVMVSIRHRYEDALRAWSWFVLERQQLMNSLRMSLRHFYKQAIAKAFACFIEVIETERRWAKLSSNFILRSENTALEKAFFGWHAEFMEKQRWQRSALKIAQLVLVKTAADCFREWATLAFSGPALNAESGARILKRRKQQLAFQQWKTNAKNDFHAALSFELRQDIKRRLATWTDVLKGWHEAASFSAKVQEVALDRCMNRNLLLMKSTLLTFFHTARQQRSVNRKMIEICLKVDAALLRKVLAVFLHVVRRDRSLLIRTARLVSRKLSDTLSECFTIWFETCAGSIGLSRAFDQALRRISSSRIRLIFRMWAGQILADSRKERLSRILGARCDRKLCSDSFALLSSFAVRIRTLRFVFVRCRNRILSRAWHALGSQALLGRGVRACMKRFHMKVCETAFYWLQTYVGQRKMFRIILSRPSRFDKFLQTTTFFALHNLVFRRRVLQAFKQRSATTLCRKYWSLLDAASQRTKQFRMKASRILSSHCGQIVRESFQSLAEFAIQVRSLRVKSTRVKRIHKKRIIRSSFDIFVSEINFVMAFKELAMSVSGKSQTRIKFRIFNSLKEHVQYRSHLKVTGVRILGIFFSRLMGTIFTVLRNHCMFQKSIQRGLIRALSMVQRTDRLLVSCAFNALGSAVSIRSSVSNTLSEKLRSMEMIICRRAFACFHEGVAEKCYFRYLAQVEQTAVRSWQQRLCAKVVDVLSARCLRNKTLFSRASKLIERITVLSLGAAFQRLSNHAHNKTVVKHRSLMLASRRITSNAGVAWNRWRLAIREIADGSIQRRGQADVMWALSGIRVVVQHFYVWSNHCERLRVFRCEFLKVSCRYRQDLLEESLHDWFSISQDLKLRRSLQ